MAGGAMSQATSGVRVGAPALTLHWPEYVIEASCLGLFMVSACAFGTLFEHPLSPVRQLISDPMLRRIPMGLAMGLTAIALIYSPIGQRSGAHLNPSTTLTFFRLGKVASVDALGYIVAQFIGGIAASWRRHSRSGCWLPTRRSTTSRHARAWAARESPGSLS